MGKGIRSTCTATSWNYAKWRGLQAVGGHWSGKETPAALMTQFGLRGTIVSLWSSMPTILGDGCYIVTMSSISLTGWQHECYTIQTPARNAPSSHPSGLVKHIFWSLLEGCVEFVFLYNLASKPQGVAKPQPAIENTVIMMFQRGL